jgi:hypothetical protein
MNNREFKTVIETALTWHGFKRVAKNFRMDGKEASIVIGLQKLEYDEQYFINVGIWLAALGQEVPKKVEHTHMYYRLERLFPQWRQVVLEGGQLSHPEQPSPANRLAEVIGEVCVPTLVALVTSLDWLRQQFEAGALQGGLIRKEAREFLAK